MILIADSGSSKTDWILVKSNDSQVKFKTIGLNPFYITSHQISLELQQVITPAWCVPQITHIFFYGSGCASHDTEQIVKSGLLKIFRKAKIFIYSDILGAARALFLDRAGIAIILGTGASSCDYNGHSILERVPAFGYILGDEGSGAVLGRELLKAYLHHELPESLNKLFSLRYNLDIEDVKNKVYSGDRPNRYLASFAGFLSENIHQEYIHSLVSTSFEKMFQTQVYRYPGWREKEVRCLGSVAYYFSGILEETAHRLHIRLTKIIQSPIHELAFYHTKKNAGKTSDSKL